MTSNSRTNQAAGANGEAARIELFRTAVHQARPRSSLGLFLVCLAVSLLVCALLTAGMFLYGKNIFRRGGFMSALSAPAPAAKTVTPAPARPAPVAAPKPSAETSTSAEPGDAKPVEPPTAAGP